MWRRRAIIQHNRHAGGQPPCVAAAPGCDGYNIGAAKQRRSIFPDQSGQPTLNLNIIGLEIAGLISRVFSLQSDTAGFFQQRLQRGFLLLDQCHHNIPVIGGAGAFYHYRVTFKNASLYHRIADIHDPVQRMIASRRLIAKIPTLAAMAYKYSLGQPFNHPRNSLNYAENFLHMCFAVPAEDYVVNPILAEAMDKIFILHADHEQNASTSTVRLAGSSGANPFACIAAGIASLWGPAHGGANEAVLNMLNEIGHKDNIAEFVARARDRDDPFRLFGFGHRVYKNFDPRAKVLRQTCHEVLDALGVQDPLLELAMELEDMALKDQYFIDKKLYPNVDFYSGIILKAMGFPTSMFTVLFAVARTTGWVAQWNEMITDPMQRIGRPRQLYTGPTHRDYVEIGKR